MSEETTTDRLAEIEGQAEPQPVQVREGRWRTRNGEIRHVTPTPEARNLLNKSSYSWYDAHYNQTWLPSGRYHLAGDSPFDLLEYLGSIEPEPEPEQQPEPDAELRIRLLQQANDSQAETIGRLQAAIDERAELGGADQTRVELQARIRELEAIRDTQAATIAELRSEVYHVQNLLGESRQRVTHLEELVTSLRTINRGCENAVRDAGKENTALRNQLEAVKAELAQVSKDRYALQIELDAAQQVPADSPELRQLRADLAEVGHDRDMYRHEHELLVQDIDATHQRTKAETVEAIAEWLEPIRREDPHLRAVILFHLPKIIRSLVGLNTPEDVD